MMGAILLILFFWSGIIAGTIAMVRMFGSRTDVHHTGTVHHSHYGEVQHNHIGTVNHTIQLDPSDRARIDQILNPPAQPYTLEHNQSAQVYRLDRRQIERRIRDE